MTAMINEAFWPDTHVIRANTRYVNIVCPSVSISAHRWYVLLLPLRNGIVPLPNLDRRVSQGAINRVIIPAIIFPVTVAIKKKREFSTYFRCSCEAMYELTKATIGPKLS